MDNKKIQNAKKWYNENKGLIESSAKKIEGILIDILHAKKVPFQSIVCRVKDEKSFLEKISKNKYQTVDDIKDIIGIRIITYTNIEVEQICNLIEDELSVDSANSVNKAEALEENKVGYISVHYVAKLNETRIRLPEYEMMKDTCFEIQVRTLLQHAWAEVEHDRGYKFVGGQLPKELKRRFYLLAGNLELLDREFENLVNDINNYDEYVKAEIKKGNYNLEINAVSLKIYMDNRFGDHVNSSVQKITKVNLEILNALELNRLSDIETIIKGLDLTSMLSYGYNRILRTCMIVFNSVEYFKYINSIKYGVYFEKEEKECLEQHGVNIDEYVEYHNAFKKYITKYARPNRKQN